MYFPDICLEVNNEMKQEANGSFGINIRKRYLNNKKDTAKIQSAEFF